jgi:hypothetical protein
MAGRPMPIYLLVFVLHNWADDDASRILRSCRAAMRTGARLLVVEGLIDPDPLRGPATADLLDMQMIAMFGNARERTEAEFRELLTGAGFDLTRVIATGFHRLRSGGGAPPSLEPQKD